METVIGDNTRRDTNPSTNNRQLRGTGIPVPRITLYKTEYPSNYFEAELAKPKRLSNMQPGAAIEFALYEQYQFARNLVGYGNIANTPAMLGLIPFIRTNVALDREFGLTLFPGLTGNPIQKNVIITNIEGEQENKTWNVGPPQLESPAGWLENKVNNFVSSTLESVFGSNKKPGATTKRSETINSEYSGKYAHYALWRTAYTTSPDKQNSWINDYETWTNDKKIFPFYFKSLTREDGNTNYLLMQPILMSHSESFSPTWSPNDVFGRPHPVWIYSNVNRNISLEFLMVAERLEELKDVVNRADWLSKHTYPTLARNNGNSAYKSGPLLSLTIGDLYKDLNGFMSGLDFDWNFIKRWNLTQGKKIPQGVKVSLKFTVLEKNPISNSSMTTIYKYD